MKILLISSIFPPGGGGAAAVYHQLCRQRPREIVAMVPARSDRATGEFDAAQAFETVRVGGLGIYRAAWGPRKLRPFLNIAMRLWSRIPAAWHLIRTMRRYRPDVVCIGTLETLYWMAPLARLMGCVGVIFYIHGEEVSSTEKMGRVSRWFFRRSVAALAKADRVVGVSRWTCDRIKSLGVDPKKVELIYNGVEHDRFHPGIADAGFLERNGLAGKRVMLTVARLDARKGHETVLKALPGVLQKVPDLAYVIVGDGPERAALEKLAEKQGISAHVRFAGRVAEADLLAYYHACDLFVQPNRRMADGDDEGFGLVFIEAGACGKPVVGGRSGGVPEAVLEGHTGLLVDGNSPEETGAAMLRILSDKALADTMGKNGVTRAAALDWQATGRHFVELCDELLNAARETGKFDLSSKSPLPVERGL